MVTIAIIGLVMLMVIRLVIKARANIRAVEAQARQRRLHRAIHEHRPVVAPRPHAPAGSVNPTNKPPRPAGFSPVRPTAPTRRTRR